jgi:4-hydroxy-4-methyl-2-oxoglutarate aldolase
MPENTHSMRISGHASAIAADPLAARLGKLYASAVHDVLRARGHARCVLPPHLRPLDPSLKVAGPVFTLEGHIDQTQSAHDTLLGWTRFLSQAPGGHVVICQPHNQQVALMGELSSETLQAKGVLGYIADGGCRDTDFILQQRFPVWHTFFTPSDIVARWVPTQMGGPIAIGDVTICTGDYVLADRDGIVIIPKADVAEVIAETERVALTENQVRQAIRGGMDPVDAYLKFGKF